MEEALVIIHEWMMLTSARGTFTSDEIRDMLLDVQQSLTTVPEPVPA